VIHPKVIDARLKQLDGGGIRGIRSTSEFTVTTRAMIEPLAKRVAPLG
jgi:hypothetical protein